MITVYGRATSSNVQLVTWTLGELGLDHERLDYGHKYGGTDTSEYRAMNPNGRVPTLTDGDLTMFESGAIVRYLAARYGAEPFWPTDPVARARLDTWAEWMKVTFAPAFARPIFWSLLNFPAGQGGETIQPAADALKPLVAMLEARIGEGPYLASESLTFADIHAGHLLYRYYGLTFDRIATPNLDAYYKRLTNRPAYAQHVMVSYEPLRIG